MLAKHPLYYHTFGAPMATRNKQVSSMLVTKTVSQSSFSSGLDGWVATTNATLSNVYGNIRATVTALNAGMQKTFSTEAGKTYRIRFKVNLRGWPYMYVKDVASTTNLISITDFMTPGDYNYTFTATGYQTNVIFHEAGNASGSVQLASFVLEEVEAENGYRFGFNGKENDNETQTQDYGMRIYDYRLGKFLSVDPLTKSFAYYSPYQFAGNKPIEAIDLDGSEPEYILDKKGKLTKPVIALFNVLLGYDVMVMQSLTITRNGSPANYGETHSESDVRTDPTSVQTGNGWLRTIGHELRHQQQYANSAFSPSLNQAAEKFSQFFKGSKNSEWEKQAYKKGDIVVDFSNKYNPEAVLQDVKLTEEQKALKLTSMVYEYKIDLVKNKIKENLKIINNKETSVGTKTLLQYENDQANIQLKDLSNKKDKVDEKLLKTQQ